jgi:hypothetical protein
MRFYRFVFNERNLFLTYEIIHRAMLDKRKDRIPRVATSPITLACPKVCEG